MNRRQRKQLQHIARKLKIAANNKIQPQTTLSIEHSTQALRQPGTVRWTARLWQGLVSLAVILTILGFAYQMRPIVTLSIGERLDPGNPLSNQLIISNDGILSIYDVSINCTDGRVAYSSGRSIIIADGASIFRRGDEVSRIDSGQKFTTAFVCYTPELGQDPSAFNFAVSVSYRPPLLPKKLVREFRLMGIRDSAGRLVMIQRPKFQNR